MEDTTLDLTALRDAVASLADAVDVVGDDGWFRQQPERVRNTLVAGLIQNFEFVFELSVKMIVRRLGMSFVSRDEVAGYSYRDLMRTAGQYGLIDEVAVWFGYREKRNITSHTYDRGKAAAVVDGIAAFLADARVLLTRLEAGNV